MQYAFAAVLLLLGILSIAEFGDAFLGIKAGNRAAAFLVLRSEVKDDIHDWIYNPDSWSAESVDGVAADPRLHVEDVATFDKCIEEMDLKFDFVVNGNTSRTSANHPVVLAVIDRWRSQSLPGKRDSKDENKIALAIEGGGMRGCGKYMCIL